MKKFVRYLFITILLLSILSAISNFLKETQPPEPEQITTGTIGEDTFCYGKDDIALYLHTYNHLPPNFINKKEAEKLGWKDNNNYIGEVCEGCVLGGDRFYNREGRLPEKDGRKYYECDVDYKGKKRNGKRIIYSDDGLIYYTGDHYNTFELLYGDE